MDTSIIEKVKVAIEGTASADELQALSQQLRTQGHTLRTRRDATSPDGHERRKLVQSGDIVGLQKLAAEHLELGPQIEVITGLQGRLAKALMVAKAQEGAKGMSASYKALGACLKTEAFALRALNQARQATDGQITAMTQARMDINRCTNTGGPRLEAPIADPALLGRYLDIRGIRVEPGEGWGTHIHTVERAADSMGLNAPRVSKAA